VFGKTTLARCKKKTLSNLSPEKDLIGPAILTDISIKDRNNPIVNIVQGHTNLTEIKLAAELLWRVGVKPEQVALGYGFYGRAFELRDAACSTPGCTFKGGTREGPCSKESGILMHYEIKAILDQAPNLKPIWDKEAAVKYLVFDKNQWVSYDDKDTFGQKIAWANSVGFDGALLSGRGSAPTTSCSQKGTYNQ
jgi:GH18 family chitinase